jgi:hypothetical protein
MALGLIVIRRISDWYVLTKAGTPDTLYVLATYASFGLPLAISIMFIAGFALISDDVAARRAQTSQLRESLEQSGALGRDDTR